MSWYLVAAVLALIGLVAHRARWLWAVPVSIGAVLAAGPLRRDAYANSGHAVEFTLALFAAPIVPFVIGDIIRALMVRLAGSGSWEDETV